MAAGKDRHKSLKSSMFIAFLQIYGMLQSFKLLLWKISVMKLLSSNIQVFTLFRWCFAISVNIKVGRFGIFLRTRVIIFARACSVKFRQATCGCPM